MLTLDRKYQSFTASNLYDGIPAMWKLRLKSATVSPDAKTERDGYLLYGLHAASECRFEELEISPPMYEAKIYHPWTEFKSSPVLSRVKAASVLTWMHYTHIEVCSSF